MFRYIGQPNPVRGIGTELALHVVVEHRRAGLLPLSPPAALRGGKDHCLRTQLPRRPSAPPPPCPAGFVGQVSVAETRVLRVSVLEGVRSEGRRVGEKGVNK